MANEQSVMKSAAIATIPHLGGTEDWADVNPSHPHHNYTKIKNLCQG
jgi:hypothetical protein